MDESGDTSLSFTESKVNTSPRPDSDKSKGENTKCDATGGGALSEGAVGGAGGVSGPGTVLLSSHRPVCRLQRTRFWTSVFVHIKVL